MFNCNNPVFSTFQILFFSFSFRLDQEYLSTMTHPKKELTVACSYLLRLMKAQVQLSSEQINTFKRTFHDVLSKRYVGHWFPGRREALDRPVHAACLFQGTPHRGSAYRCLQTKHWKDPVLLSIAERSRIPLHRYLPVIFTMWIGKCFARFRLRVRDKSSLVLLVKDTDETSTRSRH